MMFIAMDANFHLKNQLVSNYSQDPGLGIGWAYMVPREEYESYLRSRTNDEDVSSFDLLPSFPWLTDCSDFNVCRSSSPRSGEYQIFEGFAIHWGRWDFLRSVRDDLAYG